MGTGRPRSSITAVRIWWVRTNVRATSSVCNQSGNYSRRKQNHAWYNTKPRQPTETAIQLRTYTCIKTQLVRWNPMQSKPIMGFTCHINPRNQAQRQHIFPSRDSRAFQKAGWVRPGDHHQSLSLSTSLSLFPSDHYQSMCSNPYAATLLPPYLLCLAFRLHGLPFSHLSLLRLQLHRPLQQR